MVEQTALTTSSHQPKLWLRYVDGSLAATLMVVWQHSKEHLEEFQKHINSLHPRIQFTMEQEEECQ